MGTKASHSLMHFALILPRLQNSNHLLALRHNQGHAYVNMSSGRNFNHLARFSAEMSSQTQERNEMKNA